MSILIQGMEMPQNCGTCFLRVGDCKQRMYIEHRPKGCPLIELPPHGRLIDADAIQDYNVETFGQRLLIIDTAPTVIEAEGETDA